MTMARASVATVGVVVTVLPVTLTVVPSVVDWADVATSVPSGRCTKVRTSGTLYSRWSETSRASHEQILDMAGHAAKNAGTSGAVSIAPSRGVQGGPQRAHLPEAISPL